MQKKKKLKCSKCPVLSSSTTNSKWVWNPFVSQADVLSFQTKHRQTPWNFRLISVDWCLIASKWPSIWGRLAALGRYNPKGKRNLYYKYYCTYCTHIISKSWFQCITIFPFFCIILDLYTCVYAAISFVYFCCFFPFKFN